MTLETLSRNNIPMWSANIILVFVFLGYMEVDARRSDLVAEQRIRQCHSVQEESIEVMRSLRDSMVTYSLQCAGLGDAIQMLSRDMEDLQDQIRRIED